MPPRRPLSESDPLRSPDYLRGRQDGLSYAAQIIDGYIAKFQLNPLESLHLRAISEGLKFGTSMLDLTGGVMPPRPSKDAHDHPSE